MERGSDCICRRGYSKKIEEAGNYKGVEKWDWERKQKKNRVPFSRIVLRLQKKKNIAKKIKEKGKIDNVKKWGWDTNKEIQVRRYR